MKFLPWKQTLLWILMIYFICCLFVWLLPSAIHKIAFQPPRKTAYKDKSFFIHDSFGNKIAAIYYKQNNAKYTILYSHGNAEDMSQISEYLKDLSERLNVNIILYDYSGYGLSDGLPSEHTFYQNIESVYNHLIYKFDINSNDIILYGVSIGSGPTTYLASKYNKEIGGVILQSAFTSIATIFIPESMIQFLKQITFRTTDIDMFRNIEYIENIIDSPTLIIHGTHDYLIPIWNGQYLYKRLKEINDNNVSYFWVEYCGHNDIEWYEGKALREKIKEFIDYDVDRQPFSTSLDALYQ